MTDKPLQARVTLDHELARLRDNVLKLSHLAHRAIEQAVQALKEANVDLARQVIADDEQINALRYEVEEHCYTLIVLHQPAARDLRAIVTAIHIAVELERMGDHARGIAKLAIQLSQEPPLKPLIDIPRMAVVCREMLHASLDAYLSRDAELAERTAHRDDEVDQLDEQVYRELLTYMLADPRNITRATYLLWVSHNLERIADRITNICERVVFMITGEMSESTDR